MIEDLLPADVRWAEAFGDPAEAALLPEEEVLVAHAVPNRRRECTTVRHLARQALADLGRSPVPLLRGEQGAPLWPDDVVGSMTHCQGYRAAAVAERNRMASVGIDAEPHDPLPEGVLDIVSLPSERDHLAALRQQDPSVHWDCLLFSAKEAVYKTWYPLTGAWLDFSDARLTLRREDRSFHAQVFATGLSEARAAGVAEAQIPREFSGRWAVRKGLVITTIAAAAATVTRSPA
ncbi:4'-phosphopantetheinyl transferase superfamily protein [Streptomyces sp. NPDC002838]|uniref:4'-phosphopantetheinyl transferase family protein n=1 Tax=Streptomyces sp. NPDC002838 TaxID=3154436 RepID=UPI00331D7050